MNKSDLNKYLATIEMRAMGELGKVCLSNYKELGANKGAIFLKIWVQGYRKYINSDEGEPMEGILYHIGEESLTLATVHTFAGEINFDIIEDLILINYRFIQRITYTVKGD